MGVGFAHINVYDMVVYANDSSFSFVLDVHAISLVNVHGTSRCLMALLGRMYCPPVREGLQNSEVASNCSASGRARVSLPAGPTPEIYVIQE